MRTWVWTSLLAGALTVTVTACGEDPAEPLFGTWRADVSNQVYSGADEGSGAGIEIVFNADRSMTVDASRGEVVSHRDATWEIVGTWDDEWILTTDPPGRTSRLRITPEGQLVMNDGSVTITFDRVTP